MVELRECAVPQTPPSPVTRNASAALAALIILLACQAFAPLGVLLLAAPLAAFPTEALGSAGVLVGSLTGILLGRRTCNRHLPGYDGRVVCAALSLYAVSDALFRTWRPHGEVSSAMTMTNVTAVPVFAFLFFWMGGRHGPAALPRTGPGAG